jgi:hypothetical protein
VTTPPPVLPWHTHACAGGESRQAIVESAAAFGVAVTPEQIEAAKARGNANNDWVRLLPPLL